MVLNGHKGAVRAVVFTPDERKVASGGDDGTIIVWDVKSGKQEIRIENGAN